MSVSKGSRRSRIELARVLVVDDEADIRELLDLTLARMGLSADCAASLAEARTLLERERYALCLTDMRLPDGEGLEVVRLIGERYADTPVAVITAYGSTENAVAALKAGAFDYLAKPVALDQLRTLIKSALSLPVDSGSEPASGEEGGYRLIGDSPAIRQVRETIDKLARSQAPVYISGESGSGKELAARLIHQQGARHAAPFVPVNCGAIPENLMESEFFGYRKGAFTGADSERDGFFQAAQGGTLFLDEVADLPLAMQVKLLRAIQEKKVRKVGSTMEESVDVRIISATHRNLKECVDAGSFRQDLYYRLNVIELRMPPLRERSTDIPVLVDALLARLCGARPPRLADEALQALCAYSFPGNVRELENVLERAIALCSGEHITCDDLQLTPPGTDAGTHGRGGAHAQGGAAGQGGESLEAVVNRLERQTILDALATAAGDPARAAASLGVSLRSLAYRMARLGLDR
jgi:two-component system response regulator PilR (NtrC family)